MKILLGSNHFLPSRGGIETTSDLLAREFVKRGHEVHVITQSEGDRDFPFPVIRQPGAFDLWREISWADIFLQNNISLRMLWPRLFVRRPLFITHQTWITDAQGRIGWQQQVKRFSLHFGRSFAISDAIAARLPVPSVKIGNPYDDDLFKDLSLPRDSDLAFVGRLVSDKGVDVLLKALGLLRDTGICPRLTIVGDGPERTRLRNQCVELKLQAHVEFVGAKESRAVAELLNRHRILVVPSRLPEPFGIVAVEAIACGCVVAGSAEGGLPEAIGPCGLTFPNGDAEALARILQQLLGDPAQVRALRTEADKHLAQFHKAEVATRYLDAMKAL